MNSLTEFYKYAKDKRDSGIAAPLAGGTIGGSAGATIRHHIMKKNWKPGRRGIAAWLGSSVPALAGIAIGSKLSRGNEKKATVEFEKAPKKIKNLVPIPPKTNVKIDLTPGFKGAVPQAKDAGKTLNRIKDNIPRL